MWNTVMAINSFVVWPLAFMFMVYALGRTVLFLEWKLLVIAILVFTVSTASQMAIGIMADSGH